METADLVLNVTPTNPAPKFPGSVGPPGETLLITDPWSYSFRHKSRIYEFLARPHHGRDQKTEAQCISDYFSRSWDKIP